MCHVFVHNDDEILTTENFIASIKSRRPRDDFKGRAYDWVVEYVTVKGLQVCCWGHYVFITKDMPIPALLYCTDKSIAKE